MDMHEHFRAGLDVARLLSVFDQYHIERIVFVPTGEGLHNTGYEHHTAALLEAARQFPDRIVPFGTVDVNGPDPDRVFAEQVRAGVRGLKLLIGYSKLFQEPINSPKMYRVYQVCREHRLPVLTHVNFDPVHEQPQQEQFEQTLRDFPDVTFIVAHLGNYGWDEGLDLLPELLARYPNLYFDCSMGRSFAAFARHIHWDPPRYRAFFQQFADRLVWGSDQVLTARSTPEHLENVLYTEFSLLSAETFIGRRPDFPDHPVTGLNLPPEVLEQILWETPRRILTTDH